MPSLPPSRRLDSLSACIVAALCSLGGTGCLGDPVNCPLMEPGPAATVAFRGAETQAPVCAVTRVTVTDAEGVSSTRDLSAANGCDEWIEIGGVYALSVDSPGYAPLEATLDISTAESACGGPAVERHYVLDLIPLE